MNYELYEHRLLRRAGRGLDRGDLDRPPGTRAKIHTVPAVGMLAEFYATTVLVCFVLGACFLIMSW